jgi:hypothetical protein
MKKIVAVFAVCAVMATSLLFGGCSQKSKKVQQQSASDNTARAGTIGQHSPRKGW